MCGLCFTYHWCHVTYLAKGAKCFFSLLWKQDNCLLTHNHTQRTPNPKQNWLNAILWHNKVQNWFHGLAFYFNLWLSKSFLILVCQCYNGFFYITYSFMSCLSFMSSPNCNACKSEELRDQPVGENITHITQFN